MITASSMYKLVDPSGKIIAAGSARKMQGLRKKNGPGFRVWNSPGSKVGDHLPRRAN